MQRPFDLAHYIPGRAHETVPSLASLALRAVLANTSDVELYRVLCMAGPTVGYEMSNTLSRLSHIYPGQASDDVYRRVSMMATVVNP
jgi:hypothetical protein